MANIESVSQRAIRIPKRHFANILIAAAVLVLVGMRFSSGWPKWMLASLGLLVAAWCWQFYRRRAWVIRLNLLLNQRIGIQFSELTDAEGFLGALRAEKGGTLPVMRM